jgi:hypothetical protein
MEKRDVNEVFNFCYLPDNERFDRWYNGIKDIADARVYCRYCVHRD